MSFREIKKWEWKCDGCAWVEITEGVVPERPKGWRLGKMKNEMSMFEKDRDLCHHCAAGDK